MATTDTATATGTDPQNHLLSLVRDFASEKSQGERRVSALKKQIEELRSEVNAVNLALQQAKDTREVVEQELRGFEVELALNESTIQALEGRISEMNQEMSAVRSKVEDMKNEYADMREEFIQKMFELNKSIRKFQNQPKAIYGFIEENTTSNISGVNSKGGNEKTETFPMELAHLISQTEMEEEMVQSMVNSQKKVQEELASLERKVSLMEAFKEAMRNLQDMTTSQLIRLTSALGEELQRKSICPACRQDNIESLEGILGTNRGGYED